MRPSCAAGVKNGPILRPPEGLVLDGRKHDGTLACVGIDGAFVVASLVLDGREITDRGMTAAAIVKSFDELERGHPRLGLRLEPTPVEKLALERGEEALAHRIVVGVSDRAHRGTHARFPAAVAERDRRVLRALDALLFVKRRYGSD
jgi:hypothetical protein